MTFVSLKILNLNRTRIAFGAALAIGLLAAFAARSYLSSQVAAIEARGKAGMVNVVVAKHDLGKGQKLFAENVAVRPIPADYAHSSAISPGDFGQLEGQTLGYSIKAGEMILWSLIEGKRAPAFSSRVDSGRRAITLPVDEISSISGMLEPGDMIDLIVTLDRKGKKITAPLLQRVKIIATGQRSMDDPLSGEKRQYSTVTLETTPEQAHDVIAARETGKITALLRNPLDMRIAVGNVDTAALLRLSDAPIMPEADEGPQIPVLYGGPSGKLPVEGLHLGQHVRTAVADTGRRPLAVTDRHGNPESAARSSPVSLISVPDVTAAPALPVNFRK